MYSCVVAQLLRCTRLTLSHFNKEKVNERAGRGGTSEKTGNRIQQAQENGIACNKCLKGSYRGKPGESFVSNKALARVISKDIREAVYNQKPEESVYRLSIRVLSKTHVSLVVSESLFNPESL
jgi:hypothetical protein